MASWGFELIKHDYTSFDLLGRWGFSMRGRRLPEQAFEVEPGISELGRWVWDQLRLGRVEDLEPTSANLSGNAMAINMELGVCSHGGLLPSARSRSSSFSAFDKPDSCNRSSRRR
jgi:hypothetical protein